MCCYDKISVSVAASYSWYKNKYSLYTTCHLYLRLCFQIVKAK